MKTVGEFKKAGLVFVKGDDGVDFCVYNQETMNADSMHDDSNVESFAWRENTGVKPEFSGYKELELKNGEIKLTSTLVAEDDLDWPILGDGTDIAKWRPSLNQPLIADPDTKESAIHKAWMALKGDLSNAKQYDENGSYLAVCIKDGFFIKEGGYCLTDKLVENTEHWEDVCTDSEFAEYCEKMATEEKRMDIIGQNVNDGLHYDNTAQQVEALAMKNPSERMKAALKEADEISAKFSNDKPIFTQAMADAGELPPVGSEVSLRYKFDSKQIHITGTVLYSSLEHCIIDGKHKECHYKMCDYIYEAVDTRTDREKAVDEMCKITHGDAVLSSVCGKLYDAGYRKC